MYTCDSDAVLLAAIRPPPPNIRSELLLWDNGDLAFTNSEKKKYCKEETFV